MKRRISSRQLNINFFNYGLLNYPTCIDNLKRCHQIESTIIITYNNNLNKSATQVNRWCEVSQQKHVSPVWYTTPWRDKLWYYHAEVDIRHVVRPGTWPSLSNISALWRHYTTWPECSSTLALETVYGCIYKHDAKWRNVSFFSPNTLNKIHLYTTFTKTHTKFDQTWIANNVMGPYFDPPSAYPELTAFDRILHRKISFESISFLRFYPICVLFVLSETKWNTKCFIFIFSNSLNVPHR